MRLSEPASSLLGQVVIGTIASNLFGLTAEGTLPVPVPGRRTRAEPEQRAAKLPGRQHRRQYGTSLNDAQRKALVAYLKSL